MKKKELLLTITLMLFLVVSNIYGYIRYKKVRDVQLILYELKKDSDLKIGQLGTLRECRNNEICLNGIVVSHDLEVTNLEGIKKKLSDIISNNTLVLRYSEMHCDVCLDNVINTLNLYQDSIGIQNIMLFTNTDNMNYIRKFKRINKIHFNIYSTDDKLDSILVDIGMPYLFIYSFDSKRINNVFVPQKEDVKLTSEYLHLIYLKYFTE